MSGSTTPRLHLYTSGTSKAKQTKGVTVRKTSPKEKPVHDVGAPTHVTHAVPTHVTHAVPTFNNSTPNQPPPPNISNTAHVPQNGISPGEPVYHAPPPTVPQSYRQSNHIFGHEVINPTYQPVITRQSKNNFHMMNQSNIFGGALPQGNAAAGSPGINAARDSAVVRNALMISSQQPLPAPPSFSTPRTQDQDNRVTNTYNYQQFTQPPSNGHQDFQQQNIQQQNIPQLSSQQENIHQPNNQLSSLPKQNSVLPGSTLQNNRVNNMNSSPVVEVIQPTNNNAAGRPYNSKFDIQVYFYVYFLLLSYYAMTAYCS